MVKKAEATSGQEKHTSFYEVSRKILLAAVGAAVIAQEEIDSFVNRLAERGEIAEKDARRLAEEVVERGKKLEREKRAIFERRFPPPATRADVEALKERIAELSKQIEELKKAA